MYRERPVAPLEEALMRLNIPYRLVGAQLFTGGAK